MPRTPKLPRPKRHRPSRDLDSDDDLVPEAPSHGVGLWKKLLFSEKLSDLKFEFPDGTVLHAHKCVLTMASPYFDAALDGPWAASHPDGVWKTTNSLKVMKAILCFIYTGDAAQIRALKMPEQGEASSLAVEYELPALETVVVLQLKKKLSKETLKSILTFSHLHGLSDLKNDCFEMVRRNSLWAMFNPSITAIAQENPELWKEMSAALQPSFFHGW